MERQLHFPWFNGKGTTVENGMNIDSIKKMLGDADRIKELVEAIEEHDAEDALRHQKRSDLMLELQQLTGHVDEPTRTRAVQKCSLCEKEGHTKRTCPTKGAS